jgi:hypothetical protein
VSRVKAALLHAAVANDKSTSVEMFTGDPIAAFREKYAVGRRPSAFDLGMRDAKDVDQDDIDTLDRDDADVEEAGNGTIHCRCRSCSHENAVLPAKGHRLIGAATEADRAAIAFREAYRRARAGSMRQE